MFDAVKVWWLKRGLSAELVSEQEAAVEELCSCGAAAEAVLVSVIEEGEARHRDVTLKAIRALARTAGPRAVETIIKSLDNKDHDVRSAAAQALGNLGQAAAVEPLLKALAARDHVSLDAAKALGRLRDERALEPLLSMLRQPGETYFDGQTRAAAAVGLGLLGSPRASAGLAAALWDKEYMVQQAAAEALDALGWKPGTEDQARRFRTRLLAARGKVSELAAEGPAAIEPLAHLLRGMESTPRLAAVEALGRIGHPDAVLPLCGVVNDADYRISAAASSALGRLGDPRAQRALMDFLERTSPQALKAPTLWARGEADERVVGPLREAARQAALDALRSIQSQGGRRR